MPFHWQSELSASVESKACYKNIGILLYVKNGEYLVVFLNCQCVVCTNYIQSYCKYYSDKFHIQWCLYTIMDLWNIMNEWIEGQENEVAPVSRMITTPHTTVTAWLF
jgi:hypothetical protein